MTPQTQTRMSWWLFAVLLLGALLLHQAATVLIATPTHATTQVADRCPGGTPCS